MTVSFCHINCYLTTNTIKFIVCNISYISSLLEIDDGCAIIEVHDTCMICNAQRTLFTRYSRNIRTVQALFMYLEQTVVQKTYSDVSCSLCHATAGISVKKSRWCKLRHKRCGKSLFLLDRFRLISYKGPETNYIIYQPN